MKGFFFEGSKKVTFLVPLITLLSLFITSVFYFNIALLASLTYLLGAMVSSFVICIRSNKVSAFFYVFLLQPLIITSYALGQLFYIFDHFFKLRNRESCES